MCLLVVVLGAEQILTSCAAAASDVADVIGVQEGSGCRRRAVVGREAVVEDGGLDVAQEQSVMVEVVEGGVCHGENTVAFTWRKRREQISLDVEEEFKQHTFHVEDI